MLFEHKRIVQFESFWFGNFQKIVGKNFNGLISGYSVVLSQLSEL